MGLLDGLIGGMVGAEMVTVVNGLIEKHGGVQGVVNQLQTQGLGATVNSWIADGANTRHRCPHAAGVRRADLERPRSQGRHPAR